MQNWVANVDRRSSHGRSGRCPTVAQVTSAVFPPPTFVDEGRSLLAKHPRDYWRALLDNPVFLDLSGYYLVTRRQDVVAALHDHATFASARKPMPASVAGGRTLPMPVPIAYDPPDHTRFRQKLHSYFTPQTLNQLLPELHEQASALINAVAANGACDGIGDIAIPFPFGALTTLCGLAFEDRDKLAAWADAVNWDAPWSPPAFELLHYLVEAIGSDERPALAAELLSGEDRFTEDEVIGFYTLLCFAQDGMQAAIGSALLQLVQNPQLHSPLRENPAQIRAFAEEVIRLETPLPFIGRFTTRDVTIADVTIPAGSVVRLCLASANLDDGNESSVTVTDNEKIRLTRHRSFGAGVHRCLGKSLARMELSVIIAEWFRAIPDFELEPGCAPGFTFTQGGAIMPRSLPLRWGKGEPPGRTIHSEAAQLHNS
jgi:cytochrome P450